MYPNKHNKQNTNLKTKTENLDKKKRAKTNIDKELLVTEKGVNNEMNCEI